MHVLRELLSLVPKRAIVPILTGPNRGFLWIAGSYNHSCWVGTYEPDFSERLAALCQPGMTVFDVGANVGYFTLLMSRAVGARGRVFAFEPDPLNAQVLRRHLTLNRRYNVLVVEAAVSDQTGIAKFAPKRAMGRLDEKGPLTVPLVRLDDFPTPSVIKMDIEGGEQDALRGARRILLENKTEWLIEWH